MKRQGFARVQGPAVEIAAAATVFDGGAILDGVADLIEFAAAARTRSQTDGTGVVPMQMRPQADSVSVELDPERCFCACQGLHVSKSEGTLIGMLNGDLMAAAVSLRVGAPCEARQVACRPGRQGRCAYELFHGKAGWEVLRTFREALLCEDTAVEIAK